MLRLSAKWIDEVVAFDEETGLIFREIFGDREIDVDVHVVAKLAGTKAYLPEVFEKLLPPGPAFEEYQELERPYYDRYYRYLDSDSAMLTPEAKELDDAALRIARHEWMRATPIIFVYVCQKHGLM